MPPLPNPAHEKFAQLIVKGSTQIEAYKTIGYAPHDTNAAKFANRPDIKARISEIIGIASARAQATTDRIVAELARIGFADVADMVTIKRGKVRIRDTDDIPPDLRAAIAGVVKTRDGIAVKFHDKVAALEKLGKHLGMFKENVDLNVNVSLADLVNGSYELDKAPTVIEGEAKPVDDLTKD